MATPKLANECALINQLSSLKQMYNSLEFYVFSKFQTTLHVEWVLFLDLVVCRFILYLIILNKT